MTVFSKEADFEQALIEVLFTKGWEKEILYYPTEQDLIENWAKILFDNNRERDRLNDQPLTDGEMAQILEQIENLRTPLKLNGFINGGSVSVSKSIIVRRLLQVQVAIRSQDSLNFPPNLPFSMTDGAI